MPDLAELFPGFASHTVSTDGGRIFARSGGAGPPLVLLHGFPETMAMWHALAPTLAQRFTVVLIDLRGYGWSAAPRSTGGQAYAKRAMGQDVVAVMAELGHARFALAGHDRGARVGYRLALDEPGRLTALSLLDIVPTVEQWRQIEAGTRSAAHWAELAAPAPGAEDAIAAGPDAYFQGLLAKWSKPKSLAPFDHRALDHYRAGWGDPSRIHAMCEDYRAGATLDRQADEADLAAGKTIRCPVQVLASAAYLDANEGPPALDLWRGGFAPDATGASIDSGHFLAEEAPGPTAEHLSAFLDRHARG